MLKRKLFIAYLLFVFINCSQNKNIRKKELKSEDIFKIQKEYQNYNYYKIERTNNITSYNSISFKKIFLGLVLLFQNVKSKFFINTIRDTVSYSLIHANNDNFFLLFLLEYSSCACSKIISFFVPVRARLPS